MRQVFISEDNEEYAKSRNTMLKKFPWATVIAKVSGGWIIFESHSDYKIWKNQK